MCFFVPRQFGGVISLQIPHGRHEQNKPWLPSADTKHILAIRWQPHGRAWNQRFVDVAMKSSATLQDAKKLALPSSCTALWLASLLCFQLGEWEMLQQAKRSHILGKIHMEHRAMTEHECERNRMGECVERLWSAALNYLVQSYIQNVVGVLPTCVCVVMFWCVLCLKNI